MKVKYSSAHQLTDLQTGSTPFKNWNIQAQTAILTTRAVTKSLASLFRDPSQLVNIESGRDAVAGWKRVE